ncbi:PREDICTED: protein MITOFERRINLIKE 1, chloroplastic [Theobroma cacao]|uniref:Protein MITOFERRINLIKE 1, chloroplastic n=1 Tax=Theobroma cacao TaxID=3641 RepID=A0AB32WS23_THECC|nr:PREDICTED: protein MITOFERRINLIKE 1, chloroplastic [Theobroma cacao]
MEARLCASLGLPSPDPNHHPAIATDFTSLFTHFATLTSSTQNPQKPLKPSQNYLSFASTSISADAQSKWLKPNSPKPTELEIPLPFASLTEPQQPEPSKFPKWLKPTPRNSPKVQTLMKSLSVFERALIGAAGGGIAGAFTYVCLHPLDTIKTKMQTRGASEIYANTFDAIVKTFHTKGILGFYRGVSAVIVGSTASSAVYFGTCEFGKSILSKLDYPALLIPPTAGAMGNIVSSAIMVPKELITQRMQAGAKGRSWEVLLRILEKDGILGLYAGYSATLLRNLPAGVLSYSSFEYLKAAVLSRTKQTNLEPIQSVFCGALAGAISASLTTPLDVVKTRLMTQVHGNKAVAAMYSGVNATLKQILKDEGWIGLTRGMGPRVVHSACFSALGYFAFETARLTILHQYLKHKEKELSKINVALA